MIELLTMVNVTAKMSISVVMNNISSISIKKILIASVSNGSKMIQSTG